MSDIKLVCFDLNKTLIKENSWFDLNLALGVTPQEDQELFDQYQSGEITYLQWQQKLKDIYISRGLATRSTIESVLFKYTYLPGAQDLVSSLKSKNYNLAIISGSIDLVVNRVCSQLGILNGCANNQFIFSSTNQLLDLKCVEDDLIFKLNQVKKYQSQFNLNPSQICCVGDGDNDSLIFEYTGRGITFPSSKISSQAWKIVDNLSQIKSIL
jgi:phosphoserine phosphatase